MLTHLLLLLQNAQPMLVLDDASQHSIVAAFTACTVTTASCESQHLST